MGWLLNVNKIATSVSRGYRTSAVCRMAFNDFGDSSGDYKFRGNYPPGIGIIHSPYIMYLKCQKVDPSLRKPNGEFRPWSELSLEEKMYFSFLVAWDLRKKVSEFNQLSVKEQNDIYEFAEFRGEQRRAYKKETNYPKRPLSALNIYARDAFRILLDRELKPYAPHMLVTTYAPHIFTTNVLPKPYKTLLGRFAGMWRYLISQSREVYSGMAKELRVIFLEDKAIWKENEKIKKKEEKKRQKELKEQERLKLKTSGHKSNALSAECSSCRSVGSNELIDADHEAKQGQICTENEVESAQKRMKNEEMVEEGRRE